VRFGGEALGRLFQDVDLAIQIRFRFDAAVYFPDER
jgi:hypothetical protein